MEGTRFEGIYWTIKELAKKTGCSYAQIYSIISNRPEIKNVGSMKFVPDNIAQEIIGNMTKSNNASIALSIAASKLNIGVGVIYQLVQLGLPTVKIINKQKLSKTTFEILESVIREYQEKYKCIPYNKIPDIYKQVMEKLNQEKEANDMENK